MARVSNLIVKTGRAGNCHNCMARRYCLPRYLNQSDLCSYESKIKHKTLHKGDRLFQQGDDFLSLYLVHSGSFKAYLISDDGEQQITGFHFRGELLGLEGIREGRQEYSVDSLETSSVCELPYCYFEPMMSTMPELRKQFICYAGRELVREKNRMLVLGKMLAERKLAKFLLDLGETMHQDGKSRWAFTLPMTRQDIANYLSLAVETVSRLLKRFQYSGLVKIQGRRVIVLDSNRLVLLAQSNNSDTLLDKIA